MGRNFFLVMVGIQPTALHMLGKDSAAELHSWPEKPIFEEQFWACYLLAHNLGNNNPTWKALRGKEEL